MVRLATARFVTRAEATEHRSAAAGKNGLMVQPPSMQADMNWCAVLEHHAERTPDQAFTVFGAETVTYGEMAARSASLAAGLHEHGVRAGDVVGLLSYN